MTLEELYELYMYDIDGFCSAAEEYGFGMDEINDFLEGKPDTDEGWYW